MREQTVGVVGGGIIGVAVARELTRRYPGVRVTVLDAEVALGTHQTGHSSGVVHAGIYYRPGSLKAELCTRGRALLRDYCAEHLLPYEECGKVVVAVRPDELGRLDALEQSATANAVPGLRRLDAAALREIEPHAAGIAALHSPETAITDFVAITRRMADEVVAAGGEVRLGAEVTAVDRHAGQVVVTTGRVEEARSHPFDRLVVTAGLQADRVSRLADGVDDPRIVPFRGEYLRVRSAKTDFVRGLIYPVPDPRYPFLGVHYTRRVGGALDVGPNAVLALARDGYRRSALRVRDLASLASWPGFWRMAGRHWRTGVSEMHGSLSRRAYMRVAEDYVPEIGPADVVPGSAGVRAQAVARDGSLVDDFVVTTTDGITCVRNAPSPGATSSLAIAEHVVDLMGRGVAQTWPLS